jgi:hypothetical protein
MAGEGLQAAGWAAGTLTWLLFAGLQVGGPCKLCDQWLAMQWAQHSGSCVHLSSCPRSGCLGLLMYCSNHSLCYSESSW